MNTNHLKKFAQEARRKLLEQVGAKLNFVLTTDSAELREKTEQLKQLRQELGRTTKEQLTEKVAYTWFNRLMALRFMDANDYQPLGMRIITPKDGYTTPELLDEAKRGNIPDEIKVNRQKIYDLLDSRIPSKNPQNEAFKELLIAACNHLHVTFPFLFEKINDYTELLLPDDLTSDFAIVKDVQDGMQIDDCKKVEIIGWLYQFYISEKKDEVFASKSKVKKEDIPAATQLFTPRWIVEYMVQNTLGKLWLQNRPKSRLREHMPYFIESASLEAEDYLRINSPEEITFLDPASGSGHILVYAFDLFTKIYEEEGYNTGEIPQLIIQNNLYGFEIDERAAQLSALALMMKAREYNRRGFRKEINPNILCFQDLHLSEDEIKELTKSTQIQVSNELMHDLLMMRQATNYGSLIISQSLVIEIAGCLRKFAQLLPSSDVFQHSIVEELICSLNQLVILGKKFHCVVTNPPYMGNGNMNTALSEFVKSNYPDSKVDLMACFIDSGLAMLLKNGFLGMINQHSWMFLGSYENLRRKLIDNIFVDTLLHLGARTFPEIGGEVVQNASFTFQNCFLEGFGKFIRLVDYDNSEQKRTKTLEATRNPSSGWLYTINQSDFKKIPECPIGYWLGKGILKLFETQERLDSKYLIGSGLSTSNNERFIRYNWEIKKVDGYRFLPNQSIDFKSFKWLPFQKGGEFRKWFGNLFYVVNWQNDGEEIKHWVMNNPKDPNTTHWSRRIFNTELYFLKGLTWSTISTGMISFRLSQFGSMISNAAGGIFDFRTEDELLKMIGALNSKVYVTLIKFLNPTLNYSSGIIQKTPFIEPLKVNQLLSLENIKNSKIDWDSHEYSIEYLKNILISLNGEDIEESFKLYQQYWKIKFVQLHKNEEEINFQIIANFGLEDELSPDVPMDEITILQDELDRKVLAKIDKKLKRDPETHLVTNYDEIELPFIACEVMAQFISYSVGCIFGRYSLDKEGLVLANQGETIDEYFQEIEKLEYQCNFLPDTDNIIPILDDEWFEDDVVDKFYHFLKVTFGEKNFNKNLAFIEEQMGKDIRKYFIKDFYPDHIKRYKKRPIYWMFSSPKGSFNVLIYMHRYTPDTISNILNKYLKEFIGKLNTRKEHLERVKETGSASEKTKAIKESDSIQKMLVELHDYERDILYPLATERIEIDLDDGVLVNYNKFGKAIKEVNGLNDPATKKKVKQFDWIDTSQIR